MRFLQATSTFLVTALLGLQSSAAPVDQLTADLVSRGVEFTVTPYSAAEHAEHELGKRADWFPPNTYASFVWFENTGAGGAWKVDLTAVGNQNKGAAYYNAAMSSQLSGILVLLGSCQLTSNGGVTGPWHRAYSNTDRNLQVSPEFNDNVRYAWCGPTP